MNLPKKALSITLSLLLFAPHSWGRILSKQGARGETIEYVDGMVLVGLKPGRSLGPSVRVLEKVPSRNVVALQVPAGHTVDSYIQVLKNNPNVEYAEPNHIVRAHLTVNDPDFSNQHYMQSDLLNMPAAWDITMGAASIVVAVLDTGIDVDHLDLMGNLWVDPAPDAGNNEGTNGTRIGIDFNGDGDYDDTFADAGSEQSPSTDPDDNQIGTFHGTHAAGIIAATGNNATDIAGVAFGSRLMAIKVLNSSGFGTALSIAQGVDYAVRKGAEVINMSLGGTFSSQTITDSVKAAIAAGVVVVAASGNGSNNSCIVNNPGNVDGVITVGASNDFPSRNDQIAFFSCTGPEMDVVAPGVNVLSTDGIAGTSDLDGTSFSTPMVAGLVALMLTLNPTMTVSEVTEHLNFNALDLGAAGFDNTFGFGRIQPVQTLQSVQSGNPPLANPATPGETFPYPNPFNPTLGGQVSISVPAGLGESGLKIEIFDLKGRKIKTLTNTHRWDGRTDDGEIAASGYYFYVVNTDAGDITGKLTILK